MCIDSEALRPVCSVSHMSFLCMTNLLIFIGLKIRENIAGHYMESFLSRVTGKTFPGVYWSPFDDFFHFEFFKKIKHLFEFWRQIVCGRA